MLVRTRQKFHPPAAAVWPLLCDSQMDSSRPLWFRLGLPQPVQCRLPEGLGGIGRERECVSDQGTVHQQILGWDPPVRLSFRMVRTDLPPLRPVEELVDTFDLEGGAGGTWVVRTTHVRFRASVTLWRRALLFLGLKRIHRYVFRNWRRLLDADSRARAWMTGTRTRPS